MSTEIERKFVLAEAPEWLGDTPSEPIEQGYLALEEEVEVRLRRLGGIPKLTVKSGRGLARGEEEVDLDEEQFEALWPLTEGRRISKRRHRHETGAGTIEIDVYAGAHSGLIVAEIEFDSVAASEHFRPPPWLGTEVTGDDRWANRSLAVDGPPPSCSPADDTRRVPPTSGRPADVKRETE